MNLNLIDEAWIPVRRIDGSQAVIAPWEIASDNASFPDWPRPDLNIACLELLIGLVFMADPPVDRQDWKLRRKPDPGRLRAKLSEYAAAFNLLGDGPRFMQDLEPLEEGGDVKGLDMLFMDSAGGQAAKFNADLTVKRERYPNLDPSTAAMGLFTLQAHAPAGGAGHRVSLRGGGPLLTLVEPGGGLWSLIWANMPYGRPAVPEDLPWMKPARTSENGQAVYPQDSHQLEAFFGMPRRLRLVADGSKVIGVAQKTFGTRYSGWVHPLTPYYRATEGAELLPCHPRAGAFGYRNWLGITINPGALVRARDTARRAEVVELWSQREGRQADLIVAGWAMDKAKPLDFIFSRAPLINVDDSVIERVEGMIKAADNFGSALNDALEPVMAKGEGRRAEREDLYCRTQSVFESCLGELLQGTHDWPVIAGRWRDKIRSQALEMFDMYALPGLADRDLRVQGKIVLARRNLASSFAGFGNFGRRAFIALGLPVPEHRQRMRTRI